MGSVKTSTETTVPHADAYTQRFDNILNFRDVGKTINDLVGEKYAS